MSTTDDLLLSASMTQNCLLVAGLVSKDDEIVSSRTGKVLKCYSKMNVWLGDKIIDVEYSMWDAVKKRSKTYGGRQLKAMLEGVWSVKPCH